MTTTSSKSLVLRAAESGRDHLYRRGKRGTFYVRQRIPADIVDTYRGGKRELVRSLRTSDISLATKRLYAQLAAFEAEFTRRRGKLRGMPGQPPRQVLHKLSPELIDGLASSWLTSMLHGDEVRRLEGLDDAAFDQLGSELAATRASLGALLARGHVDPVLPAFVSVLHMHNYDAKLTDDELRAGAYRMLRTVVAGLDLRLQRQAGVDVPTPHIVGGPATGAVAAAVPSTWEQCLTAWEQRNPGLSRETFFSMQTAWRSLRKYAQEQGVPTPGLVTRETVEAWATHRRFTEGKSPKTVNEQRRKLRLVFVAALKAKLVSANPVFDIETFKSSQRQKATERRLPFSNAELQQWFAHPIFTEHLRSQGQSGEATYWLPIMLFFTGARPEELAGLDVSDVRQSEAHGYYLRITDLPEADDAELFWESDD